MEEKPKITSRKNVVKVGISLVIIFCMIVILASYLINDEFRNTIDTKILKKEVTENATNMIEINSDANPYVYAYDKYITVFSKKTLNLYDKEGSHVEKIDANIVTPYMTANQQYCVLAEKGGQKLYLILDRTIQWEKDMDGEIYRASVNKNGYVSVFLKNAIYKSVIVIYNLEGEELCRISLKTSYAICAEVSDNNKYLAIGQIDYSGMALKSVVQLISIDSVMNHSEEYSLYIYESESNKILSNIKFNSKNEAICMFDTYIQKITELSDERVYDIKNENTFVDINLGDSIVVVKKEASGLLSYQHQIEMKSTLGKSDKLYMLENDVPKEMKVTNHLICVKLGNEVRVITTNGWLLKRYTTTSEIQDIVLGNNIMGIVYKNKIEVIDL